MYSCVTHINMTKLLPAYVAGIVDGEGTLGIRCFKAKKTDAWSHYRPMIEIFNTHKELIDTLREFFGMGGCVYNRFDKNRKKTLYTIRVTGRNCLKILDFIEPYLIVKREQARVLRKMIARVGNQGVKWSDSHRLIENNIRHSLYLEIRKLNSGYTE